MTKYVIVDTESEFDPYLREAYEAIDPPKENSKPREACRVLTAISTFEIELDDEGRVSTGAITSWTGRDHTEASLLAALSNFLLHRGDAVVLTWGGSSADVVRLTMASMAHDIPLPPQFRRDQKGRWSRQHIDVAAAMTAGSGKYHHLSEVALRLGIPAGLLLEKTRPHMVEDDAGWVRLRQHCELDCLLTAIAFLAWQRAEGAAGLRIPEALLTVISGYLRRRPRCIAAPMLARYAADMAARAGDRFGEAA